MQTPNGILPVDKPAGWTSFDVLAKLRGALGTRKLGHSGTLDPMATGVLAVFIGKATSAADRQLDHDKTYEATLRLGLRTDTGDVTGTTLETAPVTVGEAELRAVLPQFRGDRMQLPPMYSAVKINGQPLYKAARKGQTVERTPRPITIYDIEYLGSPAPDEYTVRVACSKGTYIRVLAEEIGDAIGVPATLAAASSKDASSSGRYRPRLFNTRRSAQEDVCFMMHSPPPSPATSRFPDRPGRSAAAVYACRVRPYGRRQAQRSCLRAG